MFAYSILYVAKVRSEKSEDADADVLLSNKPLMLNIAFRIRERKAVMEFGASQIQHAPKSVRPPTCHLIFYPKGGATSRSG